MKSNALNRDELIKEVFLSLMARWDVKDKSGAKALALASVQIADGFADAMHEAVDGKPSSDGRP